MKQVGQVEVKGRSDSQRTLTSVREDDGKEGRRLSTLPMSFRRVRPTFWGETGQGDVTFCFLRKPCSLGKRLPGAVPAF